MISHLPQADKKKLFLEALPEHSVKDSCAIAGIAFKTAYEWRKEDSGFREAWESVREERIVSLEENMYDRALHERGMPGVVSNIFLLKALRPEVYRETIRTEGSHEVSIKVQYGPKATIVEGTVDKMLDSASEHP